MGIQSLSMKRLLLFSTLALFATTVFAQTTTTAVSDDDATSTGTDLPALTSTTAVSTTVVTTAATTTTDDSDSSLPAATTTGTGTSSGLPKLSSSASTTYSYPAPSVPPTKNAPFMQTSNLPAGTVFIAVGAILGTFGAAVLIWRAVVACMLHRSVKRAAMAQHIANDKVPFHVAPPAPFYKYSDRASSASLGGVVDPATGRGVRRTQRGPIPSATPSQSNLFFSPTARGQDAAGNRSSTFLPSGFYAAGQGTPQQGHTHSISLTNLRPDSRGGQSRPAGHSPPESPGIAPRTGPTRRNVSTSSLNLNRPPSGRAPSTYLEDLLDDQVPGQLPPPGHNHAWRDSSRERF